jgi:hypothetical protein
MPKEENTPKAAPQPEKPPVRNLPFPNYDVVRKDGSTSPIERELLNKDNKGE